MEFRLARIDPVLANALVEGLAEDYGWQNLDEDEQGNKVDDKGNVLDKNVWVRQRLADVLKKRAIRWAQANDQQAKTFADQKKQREETVRAGLKDKDLEIELQ